MKRFSVVIILILMFFSLKEDNFKAVFNDRENSDNVLAYYVTIEGLNTNNFDVYFEDIKVLAIIPYVSPIYEEKIRIVYFYKNIDDFRQYYIRKLKEKGFTMEANKYLISPIKINKVLVYDSLAKIYSKLEFVKDRYIIITSNTYVN